MLVENEGCRIYIRARNNVWPISVLKRKGSIQRRDGIGRIDQRMKERIIGEILNSSVRRCRNGQADPRMPPQEYSVNQKG